MPPDTDLLRVLVMHMPRPAALLTAAQGWKVAHANQQWQNTMSAPGGVPAEAAIVRLAELSALTRTARHAALNVGRSRFRAEVTPIPRQGDDTSLAYADLRRPQSPSTALQKDQAHIDEMPQLVVRFGPDLRVTAVNRAVVEVSGLEPTQIVGRTNREMGYPEHLADLWDNTYRSVFATGEPVEMTYDLPTVDGVQRYRTQVVPRYDATGEITAVTAISEDLRSVPPGGGRSGTRLVGLYNDDTASIALARADVRRHVIEVGASRIVDAAEIVVSELVANAVEHGTSDPVSVMARRLDGVLLMIVGQKGNNSTVPEPSEWVMPDPASSRGRGLPIVAALTDWADVRTEDGVEVRCLFSLT